MLLQTTEMHMQPSHFWLSPRDGKETGKDEGCNFIVLEASSPYEAIPYTQLVRVKEQVRNVAITNL